MVGHKRVPSREGGIEVVVEELAARMVMHGHSVTCYNRTGHHVSGKEYDIEHLDEYRGIRLKRVPTIDRKGLAAVTSSFFGCLAAAFGPYDVVHIHAEGPAMFSWLPRLTGKRVVLTVHGLDWARDKWKGSFGSWYIHTGEKTGVRFAHEIIVLNHSTQKYFQDTYDRATRYIPNGVNPVAPAAPDIIREKYGLEKDSYILYLGRMVPEKGCHYLVDAFKKLHTDKKLVIAGGSSDTHWYIDQLKEQAGGDDRIRSAYPDLNIVVDLATTFGCPFEGKYDDPQAVVDFLKDYIDAGMTTCCLCDTIGIADPAQVKAVIGALKAAYPTLNLQVHFHDTRGLGMVNTMAAIESGITEVQSALGGLGGCPFAPGASGNLSTEDMIWMLNEMGYETGIEFSKVLAAAKYQASHIPGNYSGHHIHIEQETPCKF